MPGYDIGPRIGIQGEAEFNRQIKNINNSLKECGSEMKMLSSQFEDNANSQDALIAKNKTLQKELDLQRQKMSLLQGQYDKQVQKLNELAQAYQKAKTENGEMSQEAAKAETAFNKQADTVSRLSVAMNETQNYMNKLDNAMSKNDKTLDEIASGARDASGELLDMGKSADTASDQLDSIASSSKAEALSGLADNIAAVGDSMKGMVEDSKEYLSIMGQLDASSQRLGYSTEQTEQTYTQLYGILGDNQTAATATANLQALGLSQQDLTQMTELAIGAWAQYGDSIPIDSLAEAINETAQTGIVTGTFADALNWAGVSEDAFNEKLAATSSESERARMIMEVLKSQGLDQVAQGYRESNDALIANNESQAKYDEAMSKLAETIMPAVTGAMNMAADAIGAIADWFSSLPGPVQKVIEVLGIIIIVLGALAPPILTVAAAITTLQVPLLPIIGIIAGVTAAIIAIIAIIQNWGSITEWLGSIMETIKNGIQEAWTTIADAVSSAMSAAFSAVSAGWEYIKNAVSTAVNAVKDTISTVWNAIKTIVTTVTNTIKNGAINGFESLVNGIKSAISGISNTVKNAFTGAINFIKSLPSQALSWGRDFIDGLSSGIMSGVNKIVDSVKNVADKIRSFLHFSRPDDGPLRDYETWMPDMLTGMADSIYDHLDIIQRAAQSVSGTMSSAITGKVSDIASGAAYTRETMIMVDGDSLILDGKVIGKSATKYITYTQAGLATSKGRRL